MPAPQRYQMGGSAPRQAGSAERNKFRLASQVLIMAAGQASNRLLDPGLNGQVGPTAHELAGRDGVRSCGAVRASLMTPAAITANATTAMASFTALSVKRSPNSQTLKMMLANGSTMTSSGWDTLSGPTCSAPCCSSAPVIVAAMNAYTVVGPAAECQHQPPPADRPSPGEEPPASQVETSDLGLREADPLGQHILQRDPDRTGDAGAAGDPGQLSEDLMVVMPVDQGQLHAGVVAQPGRQPQGGVQPGVTRTGHHDRTAAPGGGYMHGVLPRHCSLPCLRRILPRLRRIARLVLHVMRRRLRETMLTDERRTNDQGLTAVAGDQAFGLLLPG